jgi:biotin carboxylase
VARDPAPRAHARLLVLGAGAAQLGLLRAARARGLYVVAVDRDPRAPGFAYADRRAVVSTEDEPGVERLARAERVDGIVSPGADWPVGIAARVAARLGLPHPIDAETAARATVKTRQRERFAAAGVPQPATRVVTAPEPGLPLPCVVKAPDRQGQRGLSLVTRPEELAPAIAAAVAASRNGTALVEELADGPEVTVNAWSAGGTFTPLTVTDRLTAAPPAFGVALAHAWPSEHDTTAAVEAARAAAEALGVRNGPTYTQLRLAPDGPRVIELAARLGGGHDAELCRAALGIDLNGLALDAALGRRPTAPPSRAGDRPGGACVLFLVAPPGRLLETQGEEEARAVDGVLDVLFYRRPGHVFGPLRRGADRAGAILAVGESRDDALARARRAADRIRFLVDADAA